jgi:hypothetical protein
MRRAGPAVARLLRAAPRAVAPSAAAPSAPSAAALFAPRGATRGFAADAGAAASLGSVTQARGCGVCGPSRA